MAIKCDQLLQVLHSKNNHSPQSSQLYFSQLLQMGCKTSHWSACFVWPGEIGRSPHTRPPALSHYRGSDVVRQIGQTCGAKRPEASSSTKLRKHLRSPANGRWNGRPGWPCWPRHWSASPELQAAEVKSLWPWNEETRTALEAQRTWVRSAVILKVKIKSGS